MIKVGAATETALKERKHRIEDAVSATRAAVEEGIVPGGGSALIHAAESLADGLGLTGDEATGVAIVRGALRAPLFWIAANGGQEGAVVIDKVAAAGWGQGFNAATLTYGDLLADGVDGPGQGHPLGGGERRVDRADGAHHRECRGRQARAARSGPRGRPRPRARSLTASRT